MGDPELLENILNRCLTPEGFEHLNLYRPEGRPLTDEEKARIFAALMDYSRREIYWTLGRSLDPAEFQQVLARVKRFVAEQGLG